MNVSLFEDDSIFSIFIILLFDVLSNDKCWSSFSFIESEHNFGHYNHDGHPDQNSEVSKIFIKKKIFHTAYLGKSKLKRKTVQSLSCAVTGSSIPLSSLDLRERENKGSVSAHSYCRDLYYAYLERNVRL